MVTGPSGTAMPLARVDEDATTGPYAGLLGGVLPIGEGISLPPFLNGGDYTIRGPGGRDVGPFSVTLNIPPPIRWTNRSQITQVNRSNGLTVTWSGGTASQLVAIGGASSDQKNKVASGFFCFVPATPGSFTVPPSVLGNLPPSVGSDAQQSLGALLVGTIPAAPYTTFQASGLDTGLVIYLTGEISTLAYQ
jgi:hypothetical protein